MLAISGNSSSTTVTPPLMNNTLSGINSEKQKIGTRDEAIDHIKALTHDQYGEQFSEGNTIGNLHGKTEVSLRSIELASGEKQYFATAYMDPRRDIYIKDNHDNKWRMSDLDIADHNGRSVVFIFDSEFSSNTFPIDMNLSSGEPEIIGELYYVYCHQEIKSALHESLINEDEIKQKPELIQSLQNTHI
ncbi:TPA: hypothetical protein ACY3XX_002157 [Yersinia enterocolitica]|nr:hypothetical protein [Yersinia enterocolitica]EHB20853.1 hypothetical protein IOK_11080 [Yersinia enterocolitica subsp. palearctica PhRBD_Ye1]EKN3314179.1 hypothetical protein [Yersinia enterocolitica]EKN3318229.1 hypothetical protein [Yersinia enterocolitica]EKN3333992.1 hypothetical protein [Yersinia enterocolitica]EKN3353950.1 hypothetical protein [Yersinia enterocolitica]